MDMHMALLLTTLAGLSTGLGGLVVWLMRTPGSRIMALSQGFAAGVMMTVSLSEMLPSAVEAYAASGAAPVGAALRCASLCAAGMLAALLLEKSLPEDEALAQRLSVPGKTRAAALRGALATTAAIVLHNLPEGILTLFTNAADSALGPSLALAIALHNIPEGIAVAVPVYYATHSRAKSLLFALGSGLAEPAGALGLLLASVSERPAGAGGGRDAAGVVCPASCRRLFLWKKRLLRCGAGRGHPVYGCGALPCVTRRKVV